MYIFILYILFSCSADLDLLQDTVLDDPGANPAQTESNLAENESPNGGTVGCTTRGGFAGDEGMKTWCWSDVSIPDDGFFSNHQLFVSSHCNSGMVTGLDNRVYFKVNPTLPAIENCGSAKYNYRAEIRDAPSDVNHPIGTEQWWGFNYKFGEDYMPDD